MVPKPIRHKFDWSSEEWVEVAEDDFSIGTRPVPTPEGAKRMNDAGRELLKTPSISKPDQISEDQAWNALVTAARNWAEHMDQWDKFKFETEFGPVFVTIGRDDSYPETFVEIVAD